MSVPLNFRPYVEEKVYEELRPGDVIKAEGEYYLVYEVRRGRRPYTFTGSIAQDLKEITGYMPDRFIHVDKFGIDELTGTWTIAIRFQGTDITGKQYAHTWNAQNANARDSPNEMNVNSLADTDIINVTVVQVAPGSVTIYFSYEEYAVTKVKVNIPERYKIVTRYGWSRLITLDEDQRLGIASSLRT